MKASREIEASLGSPVKQPTPNEMKNISGMRRSLVAASVIAAGTRLTRELLVSRRPGTGIAPGRIDEVLGRKARRKIEGDAPINWSDLE